MAFAAGNVVRLKSGGGLLTVASVSAKSDGSQDVVCTDGHGRSVGTHSSKGLVLEPSRGVATALSSTQTAVYLT